MQPGRRHPAGTAFRSPPDPRLRSSGRSPPRPIDSLSKGSIDSSTPPRDLGDPGQPIAEDAVDPALEGRGAHRARTARPLELDLDHPGDHIGRDQGQVAAVGLHGRAHELDEAVELAEPLGPLLVGQHAPPRPGRRRSPRLVGGPVLGDIRVDLLTFHWVSSRRGPRGRPVQPMARLPHQSAASGRCFEHRRLGTRCPERGFGVHRPRRRCPRPRAVAVTMRCAHGATRHSPGADRTRPTDLRPRHGSPVGGDLPGRAGNGPAARPTRSPTWPPSAADAEQLGADALWACDHLFWHGPSLESMMALAIAATATDTATLGTCVIQLPLRQAPVVAKQAASLQTLTRGRFVLGVGVGSHAGEYEQAGLDYHTRGRQLDAGIAELRRSWASGRGVTAGDTVGDGTGAVPAAARAAGHPGLGGWLLRGRAPPGGHAGRRMDAAVPEPRPSTARPSSDWPRRSTGPAVPPMR